MNTIPEEERFAKNTIIMAQAVHESIKRLYDSGYKTIDPNIIGFAVTIISAFDKNYLIQGFIEASHIKCWDSIKRRDEDFFIYNANDIFKHLPMDKVNIFRDLFLMKDSNGKSVISDSLKEQLWELFDAMVKISIKYVHRGRGPVSYSTDTGIRRQYTASFFEEVDLDHHAPLWGVKLDFPPKC